MGPGDRKLLSEIREKFEALFDELITQQQNKVVERARLHLPHLTADDILNPNDFPQLMQDPVFNYEEGMASGLMAAQIAFRARLLRPLEQEQQTLEKKHD